MSLHEDIFGGGTAIDLVVRWHEKAIGDFNRYSKFTFQQIKQLIEAKEIKCYFLKVNDLEQRFIIPIIEEDFQLEIFAEWDGKTFSHKTKVKGNQKTKIVSPISLPQPDEKQYVIEETSSFVFIDINDSRFPDKKQFELSERISKLEISPKIKIENDLEIWDKYIQAQDILLKRYSQPFKVKKYFPLQENRNDSGSIVRFRFKVDLQPVENKEFKEIEEELRTEFNIYDQFDNEGNIQLTMNDVFRGLDFAIEKKFKGIFERDKNIVCVLPIKLVTRLETIMLSLKDRIPNCKVSGDSKTGVISIFSKDMKINHIPSDIRKKIELQRLGLVSSIRLKSASGKTTFDNKKRNVPEDLTDKEFEIEKREFAQIMGKYHDALTKDPAYLEVTKLWIGESYQVKNLNKGGFREDLWKEVKRDLYALDFKVEANDSKNVIVFNFTTPEDCYNKFTKLKAITNFHLANTPDEPDFKFRIRTTLIRNKLEKELFKERIENLKGIDFQFSIANEGSPKKKEFISIGKLNSNESNFSSLVFSIPYLRKEEKAAAERLIDHTEENLPIPTVEPNLIGDLTKIKWLREAIQKITNPSDSPNGKAVNEKLGQFIFDSSKAEEIFKDISTESEEWKRVKANEMLKLNDSQRAAILSALHARDLCLIQGPPGTGKTTVIAELIWQLISQVQNQRILLTSETNLAVDNAIEKLINNNHSIIKPLRFGKDSKFEEEGKKYSFNRIMKWVDEKFEGANFEDDTVEEKDDEDISKENPSNNAVQIWMNRIAANSYKNANPKYERALKTWSIELSQPNKQIKKTFRDKYFKYANVVGSTCSSAGSVSFSSDYSKIFNSEFEAKDGREIIHLIDNYPDSKKIWRLLEGLNVNEDWNSFRYFPEIKMVLSKKLNTNFDVVIMDEASKATPPEMLLPLCFGKKSVIIGDHKQLPPMLNEKEFKEALLEVDDARAKELVEEINRDFVETSQFERLIMNPKVSQTIVARLNIQYRMHPKINNVIKQFYVGETDKGLEPAAEIKLNADDQNFSNPFSRYHGLSHDQFIQPDIHTIWINVDEPEEQSGISRINESEVEAVKTVLTYLRNSKGFEEYFSHWSSIRDEDRRIQEQEVGIISFYGHQVKKLQEVRRYAQNDLQIPVRLKTVDKFQGMERNIVIVSTVRSDKILRNSTVESNADIGFAKAPERLNVALSRARRLLIVVGNLKFFESYQNKSGNSIYKNAIEIIRKEGRIVDYKSLNKYK